MQLITKKTTLAVLLLGLVLTLCGNTEVNGSSGVAWVSWDSWTKNATSGSIPYKCGIIEVEILPMSVPSQSWRVIDGFKNTSQMYSNIDSAPYTSLNINAPGEGEINSEWTIVFDFVNTTLTSSGVFNVGNMFYSSYSGSFTEFQIRMYGEDDQTPYSLYNLNFDEFALNGIAFDGPIEWDPDAGLLVPLPVAESQNSRFAFFNPNSGEIGKIEVHANVALGKQDVVTFGFGVLSDCSEDGWITINGTVTFDGDPVNAMVLANGQYMFSNGEQESLNTGEYELFVPLNPGDCSITLFAFVDGLAPFKCILSPEEATDFNIEMNLATPDSQTPNVTIAEPEHVDSPAGWVKISGSVTLDGTPLNAMVLANGQYMFSNGEQEGLNIGEYELVVPLDQGGMITLFVFVDGLQPYKEIISP